LPAALARDLKKDRGTAPNVWKYWESVPDYVDIWADLENTLSAAATVVSAKETVGGSMRIEVEAQLLTPQTAAQYPLRCEGNLNPPSGPGGPGGQATTNYWAAIIVGGIELHIDADNNGTPETNWAPDRTPEERAVRNDPSKPGRLVAVHNDDTDGDGQMDWFDWAHSNKFVAIEMDVTSLSRSVPVDWEAATVRFDYVGAANPTNRTAISTNVFNGVVVTNYVPNAGYMRLWRKDGLTQRNPAPIDEGGDYVPHNVAFKAKEIFPAGETSARLYLEGIAPVLSSSTNALIQARFSACNGHTPVPQDEVRVTVIKVDLDLMWETANKANQIFNPTKKDDKSVGGYQEADSSDDTLYGVHREKLYVVSSDQNEYAVSLDLDIQPVSLRSQFVVVAYKNGTKVNGSDTPVPAQDDAQIDMTFTDPSSAAATTDFAVKAGLDANGNGTLDSGEMTFDLEVYKHPGDNQPRYATVFGINDAKYDWHHDEIDYYLNPTVGGIPVDPGEPD
jgi:hypothetical protein